MGIFGSREPQKKKGVRQRSSCTFLLVVAVLLAFFVVGLLIPGTIIEKLLPTPQLGFLGQIIYATTDFDVFSAAADGSDLKQLPIDFSVASKTRFEFGEAANGQVVFQQWPRNISFIYIMNKDGSHIRALTDASGIALLPSLSPDGKQVAYEWIPSDGGLPQIRIMSMDGDHQPFGVTLNDSILGRTPHWFPDSQHIVFSTGDNAEHVTYVMGIDDLKLQRFPLPDSLRSRAWGLRISPDGQKVAFAVMENGAYMLYVANVDGSDARSIGEMLIQPGNNIVWTPDSDQILYLKQTFFPDEGGYESDGIWITTLDGTQKRQLINNRSILSFTLVQ